MNWNRNGKVSFSWRTIQSFFCSSILPLCRRILNKNNRIIRKKYLPGNVSHTMIKGKFYVLVHIKFDLFSLGWEKIIICCVVCKCSSSGGFCERKVCKLLPFFQHFMTRIKLWWFIRSGMYALREKKGEKMGKNNNSHPPSPNLYFTRYTFYMVIISWLW